MCGGEWSRGVVKENSRIQPGKEKRERCGLILTEGNQNLSGEKKEEKKRKFDENKS